IPPLMSPKLLAGLTTASQSRSNRLPATTSTPATSANAAASRAAMSESRSIRLRRRVPGSIGPKGFSVVMRHRRILAKRVENIVTATPPSIPARSISSLDDLGLLAPDFGKPLLQGIAQVAGCLG